jgi:hypothetical protein
MNRFGASGIDKDSDRLLTVTCQHFYWCLQGQHPSYQESGDTRAPFTGAALSTRLIGGAALAWRPNSRAFLVG